MVKKKNGTYILHAWVTLETIFSLKNDKLIKLQTHTEILQEKRFTKILPVYYGFKSETVISLRNNQSPETSIDWNK